MRRVSNMRDSFTLTEGATHVAHCNNSRKQGFTLAEVLITLGIIGVVAAMTMPTLMNSTQGAQYKAAYKKALSAISQGVTLNVALDGASFADAGAGTAGATTKPVSGESVASLLNARMNVVKAAGEAGYIITDSDSMLPDVDTYLFFNDGVVFAFASTAANCTVSVDGGATVNACEGFIDVNGAKGPNKVVSCDGAEAAAKDTYAADGTRTDAASCTVTSPTDVYPVFFYDQTILPSTNAAKAVLYGK